MNPITIRIIILCSIIFVPYIIGKLIRTNRILSDNTIPAFMYWLFGMVVLAISALGFMVLYSIGSWVLIGHIIPIEDILIK